MRRIRQTGETNLNLDMINLLSYPPCKKLFAQLQKYPQEVVPAMDPILKDLMLELAKLQMKISKSAWMGCRATKATKRSPTSWVKSTKSVLSDTDKLISIKGLVIRATPVIPDMKVAFFRCLTCSHTVQVEIDRGKIEEPALSSVPKGCLWNRWANVSRAQSL
ncbi:nucleic acid-binding protein [Suillus brevipes Sb2]|nr:nucleic acid-binding protein [Suillus brevipes Sb2]